MNIYGLPLYEYMNLHVVLRLAPEGEEIFYEENEIIFMRRELVSCGGGEISLLVYLEEE